MPTFCVILTALLMLAVFIWFCYVGPLMTDGKAARVLKEQEEANKAKRQREEFQRQKEMEEAKALRLSIIRVLDDIVEGREANEIRIYEGGMTRTRNHPGVKLLQQLTRVPEKVANLEEHRSTNMKRHNDLVAQVKEVHEALKPYA